VGSISKVKQSNRVTVPYISLQFYPRSIEPFAKETAQAWTEIGCHNRRPSDEYLCETKFITMHFLTRQLSV
jgi:hypothetical protein